MGRLWLALAFIAALAGIAVATPLHVCRCRDDVTLPRQGATGVPTNAQLWRFSGNGVIGRPGQPIQVYELAPHTTYELTAPRLRFTTGDGPDETPPAQPTIAGVMITLHRAGDIGGDPVTSLDLSATFDADTAVVRVEIDDHASHTTVYTTPDNLCILDPGFSINDGSVDVRVTALDLAGNASPPVTLPTHPIIDPSSSANCTDSDTFTFATWLALAPSLLAVPYLIALAFIARMRVRARRTVAPARLAITAAEELARSARRRAVLLIAAMGVAMSLCVSGQTLFDASDNRDVRDLPGMWFFFLLMYIGVAIGRWITASRVLRLAGYDGATATVQHDEVRITVGGQHATLRAAPRRVQRAKDHGVPKARI